MDQRHKFTIPRQLRSQREIGLMRRAGLVVWQAHQAAARLIQPGITTAEIDRAVADVFLQFNARPLFLNYPGLGGPFPAVTCISVNEEVVHGIPGDRQLVDGDIVTIDTGCSVAGWCGDAAYTHAVGTIDPAAKKLLETTHGVLNLAIDLLTKMELWSQVSPLIANRVRSNGFSVVETLVGHGIGRQLHEPPQVPNFFSPEHLEIDFELRPGLVIAIEPMVNAGGSATKELKDHWTVVSADGSLSAHFEHTVALTEQGAQRLTTAPQPEEMEWVAEEFHDSSRWLVW